MLCRGKGGHDSSIRAGRAGGSLFEVVQLLQGPACCLWLCWKGKQELLPTVVLVAWLALQALTLLVSPGPAGSPLFLTGCQAIAPRGG